MMLTPGSEKTVPPASVEIVGKTNPDHDSKGGPEDLRRGGHLGAVSFRSQGPFDRRGEFCNCKTGSGNSGRLGIAMGLAQ